ncbi:MAG: hypothetical protein VB138_10150 [Burkholderia sp.]
MNSIRRVGIGALLIAAIASLSACDSMTMTTRQRDTAIGAGVGGVAGAAAGGLIGNQVSK